MGRADDNVAGIEASPDSKWAQAMTAPDSGTDQYPQYDEDRDDRDSRVVVAAAIAGSGGVLLATGLYSATLRAKGAVASFIDGVMQDVRDLEGWDISPGLFQRFRDTLNAYDDYTAGQSDSLQFYGK